MIKIFFILAVFIGSAGGLAVVSSTRSKNLQAPPGFALVELFTSEGCSSCPPADEALVQLEKKFGSSLFVVGFHVDYWDRLGWKDPFSDKSYSLRQQNYGSFFGLESIYTPQAVVNGRVQMVGSDQGRLVQVIGDELKKNNTNSLRLDASGQTAGQVQVSFKTNPTSGDQLVLALVQLSAEDHVTSGENKGRLLRHINIVRSFTTISPATGQGKVLVGVPPGLSLQGCHLIGWMQNRTTWKVSAACEVSIHQP
jgi:hypothetical protein